MRKKLVITGADGFVGRNLAEYFSARPEFFDVAPVSRAMADLHDERAVKALLEAHPGALVIHCATAGGTRKTASAPARADVVASNLRMFMNLARCLKPGMRMLCMGSGAEYDKRRGLQKVTEDSFDVNVPADDYGYAKYLISKYAERTDNITCLRIFGLYGKYEDYTFKFISNAIVKNLLGLPIVINQNVVFDYLWIEDFCELVRRVAEKAPARPHYNITPAGSVDLVTLVGLVNAAGKNKSEIKVANPGLNAEYTGSGERLVSELGGFKFTSYQEGVRRLYAYYEARLGELDLETVRKDPYLTLCRPSGGGTVDKL